MSDKPEPSARIRLAKAAEITGVSVSSLRTEARRGRLVIWRVAGKDWTSLAEIDKMFDLCRIQPSGAAPSHPARPGVGLGIEKQIEISLAAARATIEKLKASARQKDAVGQRRRKSKTP